MRIRELLGRMRPVEGEVGIEIELEGDLPEDHCPFEWDFKTDGSLRRGGEYVLNRPCSREDVEKKINALVQFLIRQGAEPDISDRCGVHVHINILELTFNQLFNFILLYLILEDILIKFCGNNREGNLFCLRARDAETMLVTLFHAWKNQTLIGLNVGRYSAINLQAILDYGSLEFRALRTPEDFDKINTWVGILLRIKDRAMEFNKPSDIIEALSAMGGAGFVRQVLGDYYKEVRCPNIDRLLMDGVRRVQDIAYAPQIPVVPYELEPDYFEPRDEE